MDKFKPRPIGIAGVARSGKDTLFKLIKNCSSFPVVRVSLADALKEELRPFCENLGIDPFTEKTEEKEIIRPKLIEHARVLREETQGTYFTKICQAQIDAALAQNIVPIITDIRFAEYENDEVSWLKRQNGGKLIYLERLEEGIPVVAPNPTEARNDPHLRVLADLFIQWPTAFHSAFSSYRLAPFAAKASNFISNACQNS